MADATTPRPLSTDAELPDELEDYDEEFVVEEAPAYGLGARLGAEAFGTFVLVFIGVGVALFSGVSTGVGALGIGLAFGIAVLGAASAVGHISGGHFNPAVTLGAAISGRTSWGDLLPYWLAQLVGGAVAAGVLFVTVPSGLPGLFAQDGTARGFFSAVSNGFGEHSPTYALIASSGQIPAEQATAGAFGLLGAAVIEIVGTAIFVGVILGVTDVRSNVKFGPVAIGLTLAAVLLVAIPVTNGSINPARSTATAIFSEGWAFGQLWLFWVAPLLGAAIAGLVYSAFAPAPVTEYAWAEDGAEEDAVDDADALAEAETAVRDSDAAASTALFDEPEEPEEGEEPEEADVEVIEVVEVIEEPDGTETVEVTEVVAVEEPETGEEADTDEGTDGKPAGGSKA
ncbi:major intrinsic protein [Beutenbergia cavernae DSM 12333]|uniref:Major intrinsic protein n=1 Tax=Beutenbergia cavernae (strain ATCC BAA-8 / DSM 12333 / CCUG 43141 / JCM 11478 / NBRC 16432 / NCIMB 13614 / HKI 0122) TaxID=471853 RepID=C5BZS3_BEUC1|nr:aquaporin [Beutenbergia cavernae]ACQ81253.1 major intrinsic protein [Beutenbergia cavernae DSM 12333]